MKITDKSLPATTHAPSDYLGAVDDERNGSFGGWAITREGDPCHVIVTVNGRRFQVASDLPRPDLAAKQEARGLGGWRVSLGAALQPGENAVEVVLPDGTPLAGSPRIVIGAERPEPVRYRSAIDTVTTGLLSGWAVTETGQPCEVAVTIGDAPAIVLRSDGLRPDLTETGISDGSGGWHLFLGGLLRPGANPVTVTLADGSDVKGSPLSIDLPIADQPAVPTAIRPEGETVVALPPRQREPAAKPAMPSLAELDELSLDDIALAVASGRVQVAVDAPPVPVIPIETALPAAAPAPAKRGWMARLRGR